uniref:Uncharacterized protein n=1 Tax=Anguilla anguilla TaxID=7936 RepID=A0A0E9RD62_ANGAN
MIQPCYVDVKKNALIHYWLYPQGGNVVLKQHPVSLFGFTFQLTRQKQCLPISQKLVICLKNSG